MNFIKLKHIATLAFTSCIVVSAWCQQSINAACNKALSSSGSYCYTIGQTFSSLGADCGVQLPYEIQVITQVANFEDLGLTCDLYPNPTVENVFLKLSDFNESRFQLYSMSGRMLKEAGISDPLTTIPVSEYSGNTFLLSVYHQNKKIKTFKIIKK